MSQRGQSINESSLMVDIAETEAEPISFFKFFKYLKTQDKILLFIGSLASVVAGMILPSISTIMGNVSEAFTSGGSLDEMNYIASYVVLISAGLFVFSYIFYAFWSHLAENIAIDLRKRYLQALMVQEIGFFEKNNVEQIPA